MAFNIQAVGSSGIQHEDFCHQLIRLKYKEEAIEMPHSAHICVVDSSGITEKFLMWCWRRMEKVSWTDRVRNVEVFLRVEEERNILLIM